jgi:hypothetical protein
MPVRVNPYPRWGSSRFGRDLSFWYNDYIPEPAPVTIAVLPLTLYGAEREAGVLRFGCFAVAAMIMYMSTRTSITSKAEPSSPANSLYMYLYSFHNITSIRLDSPRRGRTRV